MTVFLLKIIAVICMVCDHIRYIIPDYNTEITRFLGRLAFPIFTFLIVEGYKHTKDIKKYIKRLTIFAFISQIPFMLFVYGCDIDEFDKNNILDSIHFNVMFTLLFGVLSLYSFEKIENKLLKILIPVFLAILSYVLNTDYSVLGIGAIWLFYLFKDYNVLKCCIVPVIFIIELLYRTKLNIDSVKYCIPYIIGYICSGIILFLYNGKLGKYKLKYFFYLFYPIHMVLFYFLYNFVI